MGPNSKMLVSSGRHYGDIDGGHAKANMSTTNFKFAKGQEEATYHLIANG